MKNSRKSARRCSVEGLERRILLSTYYVDSKPGDNGANSNPGTSLSAPFLTIQQAANVAQPGDTVDILAGIYRETVTPAHSGTSTAPITFQPYNNQKVVISGADIVTGSWAIYSGKIYDTSAMGWTLGNQDDQLFVDGQMINLARWPNTSLDVSHPTLEFAGANTSYITNSDGTYTDTVYDPNLTQPTGYWNGATIHIEAGPTWTMEATPISSYVLTTISGVSYGQITFKSTSTDGGFGGTIPGDPYYITGDPYFTNGQFQNLDAAGEFYRDPNTGKLYLWTPTGDNPSSHLIEAKHRQWAFDLSSRSYIDLSGINLFAAGINSSSSSSHLVINGISAQYVSHFETYTGNWTAVRSNGSNAVGSTGIVLKGNADTLENSNIAYSAGDGVYLGGSDMTVDNNIIHDVDYLAIDASAISVFPGGSSANDDIAYNTLYNSGRDLINATGITSSRIHNNQLSHAMLQTADGGNIYVFGANGNGTEIDHNVISNTPEIVNGWDTCGVFFDNNVTGFNVDHNVIFNCEDAIKANNLQGNNYLNNTIYNCTDSTIFNNFTKVPPTGLFENNITNATFNFNDVGGFTLTDNIQAPTDPQFINAAQDNFQLQSTSPAINAGASVPPYTNGYSGSAPDIGAYEYGQTPWTSGASIVQASLPSGFTAADIGSPYLAGSTSYTNGVFTVSGSGGDIWGSADQFQYVSTAVSGNQSLIARVTSQTASDPWAKAGVMFRAGSAANSAFVDVIQTPGNGISVQWRDTSGAVNWIPGPTLANPAWVKLSRFGNTFTGYVSTDGSNWTEIGAIDIALPTYCLGGLAVTAHNGTKVSTATFDDVSVIGGANALPGGWSSADIGNPFSAGSTSYNSGVYTVSGSGADIWGSGDQFQFASTPVTGDQIMVARVTSQTATDSWAKAGLMFRASTDSGAPFVMVVQTPSNGVNLQWRDTSGNVNWTPGPIVAYPAWIKLVRSGNLFTAYASSDGSNWITIGSVTVALPATYLAGLAVTAHNGSKISTATFDNVSVAATTTLPAGWTNQDIGFPSRAGSATFNNGVYSISGSGSDIWNGSDQFQFVSATRATSSITAQVLSQTSTDPWAKAGVMFRASAAANSAFVDLIKTPSNGIDLQYRDTSGSLGNIAGPTLANPAWLRLSRSGNTFTAYTSTNGSTWTSFTSVTIALPTTALAGLAVTSHNNTLISTATFDQVTLA
jgi:regulation of enolase protein 1 (concanavalin A-like superfamily)